MGMPMHLEGSTQHLHPLLLTQTRAAWQQLPLPSGPDQAQLGPDLSRASRDDTTMASAPPCTQRQGTIPASAASPPCLRKARAAASWNRVAASRARQPPVHAPHVGLAAEAPSNLCRSTSPCGATWRHHRASSLLPSLPARGRPDGARLVLPAAFDSRAPPPPAARGRGRRCVRARVGPPGSPVACDPGGDESLNLTGRRLASYGHS